MRGLIGEAALREFMRRLGAAADAPGRVYLTGGACAVLLGWRESTIDIDLTFDPERDVLYRALPALKEALHLNVELAAPSHFVPELPGWQERSPFIDAFGELRFHHYDFYSQALAKIERGHAHDRLDVASMIRDGLVRPERLRELFAAAEPALVRFPAIDAGALRRAVDEALGAASP